jgi:peptide/nickel transport system substrate-binding protein
VLLEWPVTVQAGLARWPLTLSELDENKARNLANQVDQMIWQEGFNLPLFQSPGDIAVRTNLANFGAPGLADVDYTAIGFMR